VADRQALVGEAEHDLGRDDEARQADRVDLRAADGRASRLLRAVQLLDRVGGLRMPHVAQALRELAGGPAGHVLLGRVGIVDDLPPRQVAGREQGGGLAHGGGQREVPRRDDADGPLARPRVDLGEVVRGQPRAADDDRHARVDAGEDVALDHRGGRVVDEHVGPVERLGHGRVHGGSADLAAGGRPAHGRAQLEVGRL
jgi:hypothetical protein